jgi:hypothetical protein
MKKCKLAVLLFIVTVSCSSSISPEEEITEYIYSIEEHFESRHAGKLKDFISEEYLDDYGYTKKEIIRFAAGYILRRPSIHIQTKIRDIVYSESTSKAQVELQVAVSTEPLDDKDIRLAQGEFHNFIIHLERKKKWQLLSLRWQKATVDDYIGDAQ